MQNTSEILPLFTEETLQKLTLSLSDRLAKISQWLDKGQELQEQKVVLSGTQYPSLLSSDQVFLCGKMLKESSPQTLAQTFGKLSNRLPTLGIIQSNGYTLSDILQDKVSQEYFLSEKMISFLQKERKVNHRPKLVEQ